jgi:hypothetical protein
MLTFLRLKARSLVSEASTSEGIQKGFLHLLWKWFGGEVVFHVKHLGLRVSEFELYGSDLLLEP